MDRPIGKNERRLRDHLTEHHMPDAEHQKRIASHLRATGHHLLAAARRIEDGDIMALGNLLNEPDVMRFVTLAMTTKVLSHELVDAVRELDAEAN